MGKIAKLWNVFTGTETKKTIKQHSKASKRLDKAFEKISNDKQALIEIDNWLKTGNRNV